MNQDQHIQAFPQTGNVRVKQAAQYLNIGVSTFWAWVKQGKIKPPIKYGERVSVWQAEYIRELAENGIKPKEVV